MREGIGGAMLMYIIIPVFIMFIFFVAFVISYASAYRSANYLVTQIEQCQGTMDDNKCDHTDFEKMESEVRSRYHYQDEINYCCIENARGAVWRVTLNVNMEIPVIDTVSIYNVSAETKTMYGETCSITACPK